MCWPELSKLHETTSLFRAACALIIEQFFSLESCISVAQIPLRWYFYQQSVEDHSADRSISGVPWISDFPLIWLPHTHAWLSFVSV